MEKVESLLKRMGDRYRMPEETKRRMWTYLIKEMHRTNEHENIYNRPPFRDT